MHTHNLSLLAHIRVGFANARETMFHVLFVVTSAIIIWLIIGSMNVNGQTYEMLSPAHASTPMELSEPMMDLNVGQEYFMDDDKPSLFPHRIIQTPAANPLRNTHKPNSHSPYRSNNNSSSRSNYTSTSTAKQVIDETLHTEGPLLRRLHEHKQPPLAKIPDATVEPQWKVPYAYGYFGASGTKHWTKSSGYRDTYKRWTKE